MCSLSLSHDCDLRYVLNFISLRFNRRAHRILDHFSVVCVFKKKRVTNTNFSQLSRRTVKTRLFKVCAVVAQLGSSLFFAQ